MDQACRFPGLPGSGKPPKVVEVHVKPGELSWPDRPILDVAIEDARFRVLSNLRGLIREVRLRPGDPVTSGRVMMWVEVEQTTAAQMGPLSSARIVLHSRQDAASAPVQPPAPVDAPALGNAAADLGELNSRIGKLIDLLEQLRSIHDDLALQAGSDLIQQEIAKLRADRFSVAVVGEFKRGKSTLINALIGEELLPADPLPCSAALFRITYGDEPRAGIRYRNATVEDVPLQAIRDFGTKLTPESETRALEVAEITVSYPLDLCRARVDIFDTPGLNDESNMTEVTMSILPQVDAALLVMMPESPFSGTERQFVNERLLKADIGRIMFVVNAVDRIEEERDRARLLENIRSRLAKDVASRLNGSAPDGNAGVEVIGVSSRLELRRQGNSGFAELRRALENLLVRQRGGAILHRTEQRARQSAEDALAAIDMRAAANAMTRYDRENAVRSMNLALSEIRGRSLEMRRVSSEAQKTLDDFIADIAREFHASLIERCRQTIDSFAIDPDTLAQESLEEVCRELNLDLASCFSAVARQYIEKVADRIHALYDQLAQRMNAFLQDAVTTVQHAAGMPPARQQDRIAPFSRDTWRQALQRGKTGMIRGAGFSGVFFNLQQKMVNPTLILTLGSIGGAQAGRFLRNVRLRILADFKRKCKTQVEAALAGKASVEVLSTSLRRNIRLPFLEMADAFDREFAAVTMVAEQNLRALRQDQQTEELRLLQDADRLAGCRERAQQVISELRAK